MELLQELHINKLNSGWCAGPGNWGPLEGERFPSVNPATGELIAEVINAQPADYSHVVDQAQQAFLNWRTVPAPRRGDIVRQMANTLREHKDLLGSLVSMECGKIKAEADGEVQEMIDIADFAVGQSRMLYGKTMHSERLQHRMYEQWHPLGLVGVISAFNFPVAVWAWNAFIAAICGDVVIWKPSPKTPLTAIAVQHLCNRVLKQNHCPPIFSLVISNQTDMAKQLVGDKRLPLISFTGSTAVGRQVADVVGRRLGRCILELSGNNAVMVDEFANLQLAIPAVVFGAVGTAGQRCTSTRRLLVHETRYQEVLKALQAAYQQVKVGNPLSAGTHMGPLIDQTAVQAYLSTIEEVREQGGELLVGGQVLKTAGYFVEPAIVTAKNHWDVVQRETFAPILYVIQYKTLEEGLMLHNDVSQGLSSAIFTEKVKHAEYFLSAVGSDCGIANINIGTSGAEVGGAFGGEKDTGGGRESGSDAWKAYMRRQTNTINWSDELPLAQGIQFM